VKRSNKMKPIMAPTVIAQIVSEISMSIFSKSQGKKVCKHGLGQV